VTSAVSEALEATFDLSIQSGQYVCTTGFAQGEASSIDVSFNYANGGSDTMLSQFFAMSVKFTDAAIGDCIQIGGTLSQCSNLFTWGTTLQSSAPGAYTATVDVSSSTYSFPNGEYEVCFGNGDQSDSTSYAGLTGSATVTGLVTQPESTVTVTSADGETLDTSFDVSIQSGQYVCTRGFASGTAQFINASFTYANGGSPTLISNMLAMSVKFANAAVGDCIQIGGALSQCNHLFAWGSSLQFSTPGSYSVLVDVQSAGYEFPNGEYEICIGNGDQSDATSYAGFAGDATVLGLTSQPVSSVSVSSAVSEALQASYDLSIQSGQYVCTEGFAQGSAQYVNVSFDYSNGGSGSFISSVLAMSVKFMDAAVGDCIQIGGTLPHCNNLFAWGDALVSTASGRYNVLVDVTSADYEFPNGDYQICFGNGDQQDSESYGGFVGDATVLGLTTQPESTVTVTSAVSEALEATFDLSIQSGQYVCTTGFAEGTAAYLNVTFEYDSGGSLSQLSSMFAMSVKFQNADIGDCIQVGGATE
jgi:hypothetical protein